MMPILPSTFTKDGGVDLENQRRLVRYCMACGAVAIGHMGYASEFFKIANEQRKELIATTIDEVAGRVPVFVGVAGPSTMIAVQYAMEAEALGADMLMLAVPYVCVPNLEETIQYYEDVCNAVSIPVILQDTGLSEQMLTAEVMLDLVKRIDNLCYIKAEGKQFLSKASKLLKLAEGKVEVIGGFGGKHMIHMLRLGVTAFMTGTEALDLHAKVVQKYLDGSFEEAEDIYFTQILPYLSFYENYSDELLKYMLYYRGIISSPRTIPPNAPLRMGEVEMREFNWILSRINWKKDWADTVSSLYVTT